MSACNWLDLESLGSQPSMPKNLPEHCLEATSRTPRYAKGAVRPNPPPLSVGGPSCGLGLTCLPSTGIGCGRSLRWLKCPIPCFVCTSLCGHSPFPFPLVTLSSLGLGASSMGLLVDSMDQCSTFCVILWVRLFYTSIHKCKTIHFITWLLMRSINKSLSYHQVTYHQVTHVTPHQVIKWFWTWSIWQVLYISIHPTKPH